MTLTCSRLGRLFCCLLTLGVLASAAEPAKTVISDTIYRADGSAAAGTLVITWPAFVTAEAVFGSKKGADKKEAALNFVATALSITQAVTQKDILDENKFRDGLSKVIDGTVQCLNASTWAKAK